MSRTPVTEIALQSIRNVGVSGVGLWRSTVQEMKRRAVVGQFSADESAELSRGTGGRV